MDKQLEQLCLRPDARIIFQSPTTEEGDVLPPEGSWERWPHLKECLELGKKSEGWMGSVLDCPFVMRVPAPVVSEDAPPDTIHSERCQCVFPPAPSPSSRSPAGGWF